MKKFLAVVASFITVVLPISAFAQTATPQPGAAFADAAKRMFEGRFACMDNYNFNSVVVTIDTVKSVLDHQYLPGETIAVAGTIKNPNNYPLVGGRLYAHILREDAKMAPENWHPYVSQEYAPGEYSLSANQTSDFSYSYRIPTGSPAGTYRVELYYLVGNRYVMSGIPYVANFTAASAPFTVLRPVVTGGSDASGFTFDRNTVKVNGRGLQLREIPFVLEPGKPAVVTAVLQSIGKQTISGTVQMDLYNWSVTDNTKPILSQTIPITMVSGKNAPITFTWDTATSGTYEVVLRASTVNPEDVPSVLDVRFPVAGLVPRIVYSGIGAIKDGSATINACVVNATFGSGVGSMKNSLIVNGKEIAIEETPVSADQLSTALIASQLTDLAGKAFSVHVIAKDANGAITDETTVSYPAGTIPGAHKQIMPIETAYPSAPQGNYLWKYVIAGIVALIVIVLGSVFAVARSRKKNYPKFS